EAGGQDSSDFFEEDEEEVRGEVDRYLEEARRPRKTDPLAFWKGRDDLPGLQRMARDHLGIPGTSAESERVFSDARNVIGDKRASLGTEMIRNLMLLKRWKRQMPSLACK
ncbi:hypothetical protein HDU93_004114, partial [Gonapodya sp. JEL0774]